MPGPFREVPPVYLRNQVSGAAAYIATATIRNPVLRLLAILSGFRAYKGSLQFLLYGVLSTSRIYYPFRILPNL